MGKRDITFSREIYIDQEDFMEVRPNKHFKRLVTDGEVRLRNSYVIKCDEVIKDGHDNIIELRCSYDPDTLGANPEGRKVKGVIHWVDANNAVEAEVRLYDRLFNHPQPDNTRNDTDYKDHLYADSLLTLTQCFMEGSLTDAKPGERFQFEREGYFCLDLDHKVGNKAVFNRTVTLRDTWAKIEQKSSS